MQFGGESSYLEQIVDHRLAAELAPSVAAGPAQLVPNVFEQLAIGALVGRWLQYRRIDRSGSGIGMLYGLFSGEHEAVKILLDFGAEPVHRQVAGVPFALRGTRILLMTYDASGPVAQFLEHGGGGVTHRDDQRCGPPLVRVIALRQVRPWRGPAALESDEAPVAIVGAQAGVGADARMVARSDRDQVALAIRCQQTLRQWAVQKPARLLDAVTNVVDRLVGVARVMDHHPPDVAHGAASAAFVPSWLYDQSIAERFPQHVLEPYRVARESPVPPGVGAGWSVSARRSTSHASSQCCA